jgi:predicted dehydrogenase
MSEDPVGVAVIGLGFVGGRAHAPSFAKNPASRLVAVSDLLPEAATRLVEKYGAEYYQDYHEVLESPDVDAVVVSVPTPYHYEIASAALSKGKHVLCEMPLAPTLEQSKKLGEQAKEAGLLLLPVLNFRFTPNYVAAREQLRKGVIGKPMAFAFRELIPAKELAVQWPLSSWAWDIKKSGGYPDFTLSVWSIDLFRWLFDTEVAEVSWESNYSPIEGVDDFRGYQTVGTIRLENGTVGTLQYGSSVAEGRGTSMLEIFGANSRILKAVWNDRLELLGPGDEIQEWDLKLKGPRVWGHFQIDSYFVDCIGKGAKPSFGYEDAVKAQAVSQTIVKSG